MTEIIRLLSDDFIELKLETTMRNLLKLPLKLISEGQTDDKSIHYANQ